MSCTPTTTGAQHGLIAMFDDPNKIIEGTHAMRMAGMHSMDAFTPFPVHGLDKELSLKKSWVSAVTLIAALTGAGAGFLLQYWTSAVDWALNVGGKPFNSVPAFVPIIFECAVLFGGISTFIAALVFCKLPNLACPIDPRVTNDAFALWVPVEDVQAGQNLAQVLREKGAYDVRVV